MATVVAAVVIGLIAGTVYRRGGFYPLDGFGLAVISVPLALWALGRPRDRAGLAVLVAWAALAGWWLARALMEHSPAAFLPLGASMLGFLAAFGIIRSLGRRDRSWVAVSVVAVGAAVSAAGIVGALWRVGWLGAHVEGGWPVSSSLTAPGPAAVLFAMAFLVALSLDLSNRLARMAVCVCVAGFIGTQNHWDLLALGCGVVFVPARRWAGAWWPLAAGLVAGLAVVGAVGPAHRWTPLEASLVVAAAVAASALRPGGEAGVASPPRWRRVAAPAGVAAVVALIGLAAVHSPVGPQTRQPPAQAQTLAWTSSYESWHSSVGDGVGPPRLYTVSQPVAEYPGITPDTALTVLADGGLIGGLLLLLAGGTVAATLRRRDVLSSCAMGAVVTFVVAGFVDYAWQLPALGLVGGCVAGLAARPPARAVPPAADDLTADPQSMDPPAGGESGMGNSAGGGTPGGGAGDPAGAEGPSAGRHRGRRWIPVAAWVGMAVAVVAAQLLYAVAQEASAAPARHGASVTVHRLRHGGAANVLSNEVAPSVWQVPASLPPPAATPEAPAKAILRGPDPSDPFMLKIGSRYYLYTSEGTSYLNVPLWEGTRIGQWATPVDVLPELPPWATGGATWAPDVQRVAGGWALYFSALLRNYQPPTHCIGDAFAASPAGPFVASDTPFICQLDHRGSIDPRVFTTSTGRLVMIWKSEDNANPYVPGPDQNGITGIYAQYLSPTGRVLQGEPAKIFAPAEPWEGTIVEAPQMVEAWGTYWLFFSGNWYFSTSYGIGVAACQSPFGPCSDPNPAPFLGSNFEGLGPGEESVFLDGSTAALLYNPFHANDPGPVIPRPVAMAPIAFTPKGPYLSAW